VKEVTLPDDIPSFPLVAGKIVLGVSAVNQSGNESEITTITGRSIPRIRGTRVLD